jgi:hypothetical protein
LGIPQGFLGGVDEYYQHLSRKSPSESSKKFKSLKILERTWDSPGSFREFLKYATPRGLTTGISWDLAFFKGLPEDFVRETRLGMDYHLILNQLIMSFDILNDQDYEFDQHHT